MLHEEGFCASATNSSVPEDARSSSNLLEIVQNAYKNTNCLQNNVGCILRRSERIKNKSKLKKMLQESDCVNIKALDKKLVASKGKRSTVQKQNENSKKGVQKKNRSYTFLNLNSPLLSYNATQVTHLRIPECVKGDFFANGKKYIVIKWKDGGSDYVAEENLTIEMKKLLFHYHRAQLLNLRDDLSPSRPEEVHIRRPMENLNHNSNTGFSNHNTESVDSSQSINKNQNIKIEKSSIIEFKSQQKICFDDACLFEKMGLDDPELDFKLFV